MLPAARLTELLEEMIRENRLAEQEPAGARKPRRFSLFGGKRKPIPFTAEPTAKSRDRRSDLTVAALGVTLGLICALFPWYIFFNPDEFGVRAMKFGGSGDGNRADRARRAAGARRRAGRFAGNPADEARPARHRHRHDRNEDEDEQARRV